MRTLWQPLFKGGYTGRKTFLGRDGVKYHDFTLEAWEALFAALEANGYGRADIISTYYPRYIAGTTVWSLHSYSGVAVDIDPAKNPFKKGVAFSWSHTKFTPSQVEAVKGIRTNSGAQVWRWGGDSFGATSHDYMHWQLNCTMDDIRSGIDHSTVPEGGATIPEEDEDVFRNGDEGEGVRALQRALLRFDTDALPKWGADADFGDETEAAVRAVQEAYGLPVTGVADSRVLFVLAVKYGENVTVAVGGIDELEARVNDIELGLDGTIEKVVNVIDTLRSVGA